MRTWDLNNEKKHKSVFKPRSVQGKRVTPTCCTYSRDGKLIAAGCQDGTIQIWDRNLSVSPPLFLKSCWISVIGIDNWKRFWSTFVFTASRRDVNSVWILAVGGPSAF